MNSAGLKYPGWQAPLQDLVGESDPKQWSQKMYLVETLLLERLLQLRQESDGRAEHEAINDALSIIHGIKRDKLGFPDWK